MNGVRVQRVTALFRTAEAGFWMKCFACWGRSSDLTHNPPPADFYLCCCFFFFLHANPLQGVNILSFFMDLLLLFLGKLETCVLSMSSTKAIVVHLHIITNGN